MSMSASREGLEGEPDWIIDHALRRKREELERQWKEREARMARIREEEKSSAELHGNKRRKMGSSASKAKHGTSDEETAFLLDDWNESGKVADDSPMSLFSKETRALMEKVGLGAPTKETEEDDDHEDQLKVNALEASVIFGRAPRLTRPDNLYLENPFPAVSVYLRTSTTHLPPLYIFIRRRWNRRGGRCSG